jgi:hypothetical protein
MCNHQLGDSYFKIMIMMMTLSLANICKLDTTFMIKHVGNMVSIKVLYLVHGGCNCSIFCYEVIAKGISMNENTHFN